MRLAIEVEHEVGSIVYLKTDSDQKKYQIFGYLVRMHETMYELYSVDSGMYTAYDFEISKDKILI